MNRGRIQAQDDKLEKSAAWATIEDHTKSKGLERVDNLESQLTPRELKVRVEALRQARDRIRTTPACGVSALWKKSFYDDFRNRKVRVDIDVLAGVGFIDDPIKE